MGGTVTDYTVACRYVPTNQGTPVPSLDGWPNGNGWRVGEASGRAGRTVADAPLRPAQPSFSAMRQA